MDDIDLLKLYRGNDIEITKDITIHIPTIGEIVEFGEAQYYSLVFTMCSVGADLKWQLDDMNIDYTQVEDYELFSSFIAPSIPKNLSSILFGDELDFSLMRLKHDEGLDEDILTYSYIIEEDVEIEIGGRLRKFLSKYIPLLKKTEIVTTFEEKEIMISRYIYEKIVGLLRYMHFIERNNEIPGNEMTKMFLIDEARENYLMNKDKPYKSQLFSMLSAMVNSEGFPRDDKTVFSMNIFAFMDSVKRINKIRNAQLLLQSGYSGFGVNLKDIEKDQIDWMS